MNLNNDTPEYLNIDITRQQLTLFNLGVAVLSYPVSTAKNGAGELKGSECTPRGWHSIRAKIGADQPLHSVFIGRRATGEIYSPELAKLHPQRDWILTRILWLGGLEPHKNRYGNVDSTWRYIYIHGCPDDTVTGIPQSHGCIRMRNNDLLELFNRIAVGIKVYIHE
ncbi:MAG: L,D-transpeptidase [Methylococcales bacterium]